VSLLRCAYLPRVSLGTVYSRSRRNPCLATRPPRNVPNKRTSNCAVCVFMQGTRPNTKLLATFQKRQKSGHKRSHKWAVVISEANGESTVLREGGPEEGEVDEGGRRDPGEVHQGARGRLLEVAAQECRYGTTADSSCKVEVSLSRSGDDESIHLCLLAAGLLRCGKSCRLRWINYLRADLKRGNITEEEEEMIMKLHATLGNRYGICLPNSGDRESLQSLYIWYYCTTFRHSFLKGRKKPT
jgi:hypothetical protein